MKNVFKGQKNFCIAPFTQITFSPSGSFSPCPEIGGRTWKNTEVRLTDMWNDTSFKQLREQFIDNGTPRECTRCWDQELDGNQSLRKRLFTDHPYDKKDLIPYINERYQTGPKQMNIMVGNKCNLRCRICKASISVTYNTEGEHYEKKYNLDKSLYTSAEKNFTRFTEEQIQSIFQASNNLERIEFYGGEPMLDVPTLGLLKKLINAGRSKDITLFYNTNATNLPTSKHLDLWKEFKAVELNLSLDDIGKRFTYNRYPGKWEDVLENINLLSAWNDRVNFKIQIIVTVSILNIYYLPEMIEQFDKFGFPIFWNHVYGPDYYDIRCMPEPIRLEVKSYLRDKLPKSAKFLLNMLDKSLPNENWEQFKFWTRAKDEYRKESFASTYPEFAEVIQKHDNTFIG